MDEKELEDRVDVGIIFNDIGTIIGAVGGIFIGEQLNDYIPQLQQAPLMIHFAVDIVSIYGSSVVAGRIGQRVGEIAHTVIRYF